jgi:hypothetical protein
VGVRAGSIFAEFNLGGDLWFLLGVLAKTGAQTWCFDGQFVVGCVVIVVF